MADPVLHLTAFGWPVDTAFPLARPFTEIVPKAAKLLRWEGNLAPGTLMFDAIAHGLYTLGFRKTSDERHFWIGVRIAVRYWEHYRPWTRNPPEGFREPNFDMFTAECEALENRGKNMGSALRTLAS